MQSGILAGNYTSEIWPQVKECIEKSDYAVWWNLVNDNPPKQMKSPYFLVIDIHGFSKFCRRCETDKKMQSVGLFLRAFFQRMSLHISFKNGACVKFIGDAILVVHESRSALRKLGNELIEIYDKDFKGIYPGTDVVVLITHPRECLKGFVGGVDYVDFSYWAPGLNNLFSQTKLREEGHVYFVKRDGTVLLYDS